MLGRDGHGLAAPSVSDTNSISVDQLSLTSAVNRPREVKWFVYLFIYFLLINSPPPPFALQAPDTERSISVGTALGGNSVDLTEGELQRIVRLTRGERRR